MGRSTEVRRAKLRVIGVGFEASTARLGGGVAEGAKGPLAGGRNRVARKGWHLFPEEPGKSGMLIRHSALY